MIMGRTVDLRGVRSVGPVQFDKYKIYKNHPTYSFDLNIEVKAAGDVVMMTSQAFVSHQLDKIQEAHKLAEDTVNGVF